MTEDAILTVGASIMGSDSLVSLLQMHAVTAVADVRSIPASKFTPQFDRKPLEKRLARAGIAYVFLGHELGARSQRDDCYVDGVVQYGRLAQTPEFQSGIERLRVGAMRERIVLLCTEKEPLDCHRTILVARVLSDQGFQIEHIHTDGSIESHSAAMLRLLEKFNLDQPQLWSDEDPLELALRRQEDLIAYVKPQEQAD